MAAVHPVNLVLVHRNRPGECLRALAAFRSSPGVAIRPLVVDNGSAPDRLHRVRAGAPDAEVLSLGRNLGYGPAANVALRRWLRDGTGEWVVVAPDDAVPDPGCLARLFDAVRGRPRAGLVSAEFGPGHEYAPTVDRVLGPYNRAVARGQGFEAADYGHGTLLALRRRCLEEVGLFDEAFFAYCEEADLGLRARLGGWEAGFVWGAVVHNGDPSFTPVSLYLQLRNTLRLVRKHSGPRAARTRLAFAVMALMESRARGRRALARAQARAIRDYRARRFGPPPSRPRWRGEGAVPDRALLVRHHQSSRRSSAGNLPGQGGGSHLTNGAQPVRRGHARRELTRRRVSPPPPSP